MQRHFTSGSRQAPDPFDQFLEQHNYYRKHTARDPSCLFRVISEQMYDTQRHHLAVRKRCVMYMRKHRQYFEPLIDRDFDEYLDDLCKPKTHGTLIELQAVGFMFERTIMLFEPFNLGKVYSMSSSYSNKVFRVFFTPEYHFDSVFTTDYIKDAAICQAIVYELLYKDLFKLPDVSFAVEQMLYISPHDCSSYSTDLNREGYSSYIRLNNGHSFKLDLPSNTNCVLENFKLCHFHNADFSNLDLDIDSYKKSENCGSVLPLKFISCVRQLLHEGITPFPYKVAKALDPNMYRNIEFDSWSELRKELRLQNWYNGDYNFKVGAKCHVRLSKTETDLYTCHIQEISADKTHCVVFIEQLAEKRVVPYENLSPLPPDQFNPWALPYRLQQRLQKYSTHTRYPRSNTNYRWRFNATTASTAATCYLRDNQYYRLKQYTQLDYFRNQTFDYYTMPFIVDHTGGSGIANPGAGTPAPQLAPVAAVGTNNTLPSTAVVTAEEHPTNERGVGTQASNQPSHVGILGDRPSSNENGGGGGGDAYFYTDVQQYTRYPVGQDDNYNQNSNGNAHNPYEGGAPPPPHSAYNVPPPMYVMYNPATCGQPGSYYVSPSNVQAPAVYGANGNPAVVPIQSQSAQYPNPYFQNPPNVGGPPPHVLNNSPIIRGRGSGFTTTPVSTHVNFDAKRSFKPNGADLPHDMATLRYFFNLGVDYHNSQKNTPNQQQLGDGNGSAGDGPDKKSSIMDIKNIKIEENAQESPAQSQPLLPLPDSNNNNNMSMKSGGYQHMGSINYGAPPQHFGGPRQNRRNNNPRFGNKERQNYQRGGGGNGNGGAGGSTYTNNYHNKNTRMHCGQHTTRSTTPNSNRQYNQSHAPNSATSSITSGAGPTPPPPTAQPPPPPPPALPQTPSIIEDHYDQCPDQSGGDGLQNCNHFIPIHQPQQALTYFNYDYYDGENAPVPALATPQVPANASNGLFVPTPYGVYPAPPGMMSVNPVMNGGAYPANAYVGVPAAPQPQIMQIPNAPLAAPVASSGYYAPVEASESNEGCYQMPYQVNYPLVSPSGQYYYAPTPAMMQQMQGNGGNMAFQQPHMPQQPMAGMQPIPQSAVWVPHQQQAPYQPQYIPQQQQQVVEQPQQQPPQQQPPEQQPPQQTASSTSKDNNNGNSVSTGGSNTDNNNNINDSHASLTGNQKKSN